MRLFAKKDGKVMERDTLIVLVVSSAIKAHVFLIAAEVSLDQDGNTLLNRADGLHITHHANTYQFVHLITVTQHPF